MSNVLIAGGTGLVGKALAHSLRDHGHGVVLLSRRRDTGSGFAVRDWSEIDATMKEVDAVVNLSGESVAGGRWSPARRRAILESRILSTRRLVETMGRTGGPKVLVNASAVGYYGFRADAVVDETSPNGEGFLAEVCRAWEAEADAALGIRVVKLRLGMVLAREGGALPPLARLLRWGLGTKLGSGRQGMSWIHIEDLVHLIQAAALEPRFEGPYNAVAPEFANNGSFMRALGRVLHRPILPVPGVLSAALLRLGLGPLAKEMLLGGPLVRPSRLMAMDFPFRHPTLEEALASLLA